MYNSRNRAPGRPRRSRTLSDPGYPYVAPPFKTAWPAPARRTTEPMNAPSRTPSRNSSVERLGDPFVPSPGSLLAHMDARSLTNPSTPVSPGSHPPQHYRSSSRQGSLSRIPLVPLIQDVPQPPRTALNTPPVMPTPQISSSYTPSFPNPQPNRPVIPSPHQQSSFYGMSHQGSSRSVRQGQNQGLNDVQNTLPGTHPGAHHGIQQNGIHHSNSNSHYSTHRSHSRPPSAASHRYASSITQPVYGHGSSANLGASRTSLNGAPPKNQLTPAAPSHHNSSLHPGISSSLNRPSLNSNPSNGRSRPHSRLTPSPSKHHEQEIRPGPPPPIPANQIHHTTQRPPLPDMPAGYTHTRYVNMLLALDDIAPLFNMLASFFTWILLAGFLLFPGTFTSLKQQQLGGVEAQALNVISDVPLFIIAWLCTGIGAIGMIWLWWRWQRNYVWIVNRVFVPGLLNSLAGIISVFSNIYGVQNGTYSTTSEQTIIVIIAVAVVCGCLVIVYQFWLLRNIKKEHDREVGVELAGKHGEGVVRGEK